MIVDIEGIINLVKTLVSTILNGLKSIFSMFGG